MCVYVSKNKNNAYFRSDKIIIQKLDMERIKLHDKYFKPFITNDTIEANIEKVAQKISVDYKEVDKPLFLSVLNGSFMFTASLMKKIDLIADISFIKLASYEGTASTGNVRELIGINEDITGRSVIIVEDIVDTGSTIEELHTILKARGVADIRVCTLFLKPESYSKPFPIDYPAMEIGNEFIVGFGLDYNHLGRQYKDIYVID